MVKTMNSLLNVIQNVRNFVDPIISVLESVLGNNSLAGLVNCKFIGINVINLINTFGGVFSQAAYNLGVLLCLIACINIVVVILTIILINNLLDSAGGNQVVELASEQKPLNNMMVVK